MKPEVDKVYRRGDGKYFIVLEIAKTLEGKEFVIYRDLADGYLVDALALPVEMWRGFVEVDPVTEFQV